MSAQWRFTAVLLPLSICTLSAIFFGNPDRWLQAIVWATLIFAGQGIRLIVQIEDPGPEPEAIAQRLKEHRARVLFSAIAWGSAGFLLFDRDDITRQLALTVVLVSSGIAFSLSASAHAATLKLALPLLLGPIILSLLLSPQPYMWVMAMMGTSFYFLMRRLVTDRGQQLEETLNLRLVAQEAQEEKQRFFAAASHDLRQPLQALSLYQGVLNKGDLSPNVVQRMGDCIEALDRLLAGVLDISRLDSGKVVPAPVPIHLPALMLRVASMHEPAMREKGLRLRLHAQDIWVHSDPALLERILSNLLSNATRYTEAGGILFAARKGSQTVRLQIFDTGIGIEASAFQSIFSEFTQLNNPARDPAMGSGLGLATVQRMVHLLGHAIELKSVPGRGSCFQLTIPTAASPAPDGDPKVTPEADASASLLRRRVLVVEDNALVADALCAMLRAWNLDVTLTLDANNAMAALQESTFDVVISDWRLPGEKDGVDVLRFARLQHPSLQLAALLTGDNAEALRDEFSVITKPVRALRLRALLSAHLR
ncbi:ATP-binding response regulator [Hydrogenophaga crassostreae]|nr:hybrid sensor histidine kinase/response regulator [Hydrogenophaga crassostreae]